jgi:molybdopterin molybdotransferase
VAQLSDDCFAFGGKLLTVDAALSAIAEETRPVRGTERVALHDADGRVLAADLLAPMDLPPFRNSAVDGYAVRLADLEGQNTLPVLGRLPAGTPVRPARTAVAS